LSMMGNRSDRRFPNLSCPWALEAVWLTRRRRRGFPSVPGAQSQAPYTEAEYMAATGVDLIAASALPLRAGSI
jgi:hypothetical protein